jgi:suppressor of ftsI
VHAFLARAFRHSRMLLFIGALTSCVGGGGGIPTGTSVVSGIDMANPAEVDSSNGVLNLTLTAVINPSTGGPAISYNGSYFPPTLRVWPGDTIEITYVNDLPTSSTAPYNGVSLHYHGLSTSPNPPADDSIDMLAMPGQTLHYVVPVPTTQPPGLYWYHSHAMGESNWQLYNGMSAALIVNGTASYAKETGGLPERVIVLRNLLAHPVYGSEFYSTTRKSGATTQSVTTQSTTGPTPTPAPYDDICSQPWGITSEYTSVNGEPAGTQEIVVPAGEKQLWRVVNASADGFYNLSIDGHTLQIVSVDGVPLEAYPGGQEQSVSNYILPPAGRVEFIVTGASGSAAFRTTCVDTGPAGDPNPSQILATVNSSGKMATLPSIPTPGPTAPAQGTYEETVGAPAQQRTVTFTENDAGTEFYLNGQQYSATGAPMFTVSSGTIEEWTLQNATLEVHAFHSHQVHFIVLDINGVTQPAYWRDTVTLPIQNTDGTASVTHILLDFRDPEIKGTFLFHCHLLEHADGGMQAKVTVQ